MTLEGLVKVRRARDGLRKACREIFSLAGADREELVSAQLESAVPCWVEIEAMQLLLSRLLERQVKGKG